MSGYKMVPVVPTHNMRSAAGKLFCRKPAATPAEYYAEMLNAAPDAPAQQSVNEQVTKSEAQPVQDFAEWLATEMPRGTIIEDPGWWASRIARQYVTRYTPPSAPVGVETVDAAAWDEVLELPEGFRVAKHWPGIWEYQFDIEDEADEDSDRMVSSTSWNHPALAAIAAWIHAYEALAQKPAALHPKCDGNHGGPRCADPECWNDDPQPAAVDGARPLGDWHEDDGPVVWWKLPVDEPAWIGTPLDSDWPGYHTHWTPHPTAPALAAHRKGVSNE